MQMKKNLVFWALAAALLLLTVVMVGFMFYPSVREGCDFDLRVNEIHCVLERCDPFDIWSEQVDRPPYYSYARPDQASATRTKCVNAYPPWAYLMGYPFAALPRPLGWFVYLGLNLCTLLLLGVAGYRYAKARLPEPSGARIVAAAAVLLIALACGSCYQSGNYPILVLLATLGMVWCLDRRHDVLAGFCWALAMIKPQLALLFAVPLLWRRKYLTCAVAALTCVIASVPAMVLCRRGFVDLVRHGIGGSSCAFMGCGTFPGFLCPLVGQSCGIIVGLAVGAALCVFLTVRTPRSADWFVFITPAALIATGWTYSQLYNSVMAWFFFVLILIALVREPQNRTLRMLAVLSALTVARPYTFLHGFLMLCPARFNYSFELHWWIDSVGMLLSLVVFSWFWLLFSRMPAAVFRRRFDTCCD